MTARPERHYSLFIAMPLAHVSAANALGHSLGYGAESFDICLGATVDGAVTHKALITEASTRDVLNRFIVYLSAFPGAAIRVDEDWINEALPALGLVEVPCP